MQSIKCNNFILLVSILSLAILPVGSSASEGKMQTFQMASSGKHKMEDGKGMHMGGGKHSTVQRQEGSKSKKTPHGFMQGKSHGGHGKSYAHGLKGHHGGYAHHDCPFAHVLKFKTQLGLTDDQLTAIDDQKFEYNKNRIMSKATLEIARMDLNRLLHSATINEASIRELATKIGNIKQEKVKSKIEAKLTLLKTLTDGQRGKINQMYKAYQ